jgi:hypothetical protein
MQWLLSYEIGWYDRTSRSMELAPPGDQLPGNSASCGLALNSDGFMVETRVGYGRLRQ